MLIDSHAHLDMDDFREDLDDVLQRALDGGVTRIIAVGIDITSSVRALELANRYDFIFSSIGYHPHNALDADPERLKELGSLAGEDKVVAWGEIGLDFFRLLSPREKQIEVFERQVEMSAEFGLPIIVHDRDAHPEVLDILRKRGGRNNKGVIHCFSGDYALAMAFIDIGYHISIPGTVTYNNNTKLQEVARRVPIESLLIETDSPFLAPVPKRGKRNEPLFVRHTAARVAQLRGMDFEDLAFRTSENAKRVFGLE